MDTDKNLLLCLLAVQTLGGENVPAGAAVFKGLKDALTEAKQAKYIEQSQATVATTSKAGKPGKKKVDVLSLTAEGRRVLQQSGSPEAAAAAAAAALAALRQGLEADRAALREEVVAALATKGKGKGEKLAEQVAGLNKAVADLQAKLQKLEEAVRKADLQGKLQKLEEATRTPQGESPQARIEQAFEALRSRLDRALAGLPAPAATPGPVAAPPPQGAAPARQPAPPAAAPARPEAAPAGPAEAARLSLRSALRNAYENLCCLREYEDGVVELPRLFHEARKAVPDLSAETFRQYVESLWGKREAELHILNEVREATEPDKAIHRNGNLYYFIYWPQP